MKTSIVLFIAALTTSVMANPMPSEAELDSLIEARSTCLNPGVCSWGESGQCEWWCNNHGGFKVMQGCGWGRKRCCCNKK
ncbi:hypothetical protein GQ53DRAFT_749324 [Thozetella sp. PMI_491]|nr:hypothetical protein GQ53DRAFT_749324 [Thozetella sp. PMI_491]